MIRRLLKKYKRFIEYAVIGCINTLVDFCVFTLFSEVLHASAALSQAAGYLAGIVCSFLLNRNITFRDGSGSPLGQAVRYAAVNLVSLGVSTWLISVLTGAGLNRYIAKILVTVLSTFINYFGYKLFVFHIRDNRGGKAK